MADMVRPKSRSDGGGSNGGGVIGRSTGIESVDAATPSGPVDFFAELCDDGPVGEVAGLTESKERSLRSRM